MFIQNEEYNFQADRYIFLFCVTYWIVSDVFLGEKMESLS